MTTKITTTKAEKISIHKPEKHVQSMYSATGFDLPSTLDALARSSRKTLVYKKDLSPTRKPDEPIVIIPGNQIHNPAFQFSLNLGKDNWMITTRLLTRRDRSAAWYWRMRSDRDGNLWLKPGTFWPI
jgi:hypothetical protein